MWLLLRVLADYDYHDIATRLGELPRSNIVCAMLITALSYAVLTGYDFLGLAYVQHPLAYRRIALASFCSYVFSYNLGLSVLGSGAIRYRLYSAWGLSTLDIARIVGFGAVTFWLGCLALAGISFAFQPINAAAGLLPGPLTLQPLGVLFMGVVSAYLGWCAWQGRRVFKLGPWEITVPSLKLAAAQLLLSGLDCVLAGAVLYALMPYALPLNFIGFLGVYLFAVVLAMVSHVPGGLGVFETAVVLQLSPATPAPYLLGSLVAFRAIYYLLPFLLGTLLLGGYEALRRGHVFMRTLGAFYRAIPEVAPRFLSVTVFLGGVVLLASGATPSIQGRLAWLNDFLPLPIMEASHLLGSLVGVGLLFLARGLQRRLDAAYHLTAVLLVAGVVASLLKGFDYEEALTLSLMLAILLPCRAYFYRRASIVGERFTWPWMLAMSVALGGSVWLGFFSFKHTEYTHQLWWSIALFSDEPRFLRASLAAVATLTALATASLLRPSYTKHALPDNALLDQAQAVLRETPRTTGYLALLGDKEILMSERGNAFVMYGVESRSYVAMGDPVGSLAERRELAWRFYDLADLHGGWPVFYQVGEANLGLYLDLGLTVLKLGEEARVPLADFSLEGSGRKELRYVHRRLSKEGCTFRLVPAAEVPPLLPRLREISTAWLDKKNTREKGFSLGFYADAYMLRLPLAVVMRQGEIVAFANVWQGAPGTELSVDLMRNAGDAPPGVIDFVLIGLMLWGREQGYLWFNLGMAPFAGLSDRASASFWARMGSILFRHGERFYNFQGLRHYKDKYQPVWEPRYLASPGGLALAPIVTHIAALVSRGLRGVVSK